MKIYKEIEAIEFEEDSWDCEDFWNKLHSQDLEGVFDLYAENMFPDGVEETEFNDWIRLEGDDILRKIGYEEEDK